MDLTNMDSSAMCRICLTEDVRMYLIAKTRLQEMYEKITMMPFITEDCRPLLVCYMCQTRLNNCYQLKMNCLQSEELFTQMSSSMLKQCKLKPVSRLTLSTTAIVHINITDEDLDDTADGVKIEMPEDSSNVTLKEENVGDEKYEVLEEYSTEIEYMDTYSTDSEDSVPPKITKTNSEKEVNNKMKLKIRNEDSSNTRTSAETSALKDTEDATTSEDEIEIIKDEQTEAIKNIYIREPKIVTQTIKVKKPVPRSKILETCDKVDKCDENVLTFEISDVDEQASTNDSCLEQNVSSIPSRPFSCDTCNKCFTRKDVLKIHILTHTGEKPYQCNVCKKCFIQRAHLQSHIRTHTGEKPYQCNVCKKSFNKNCDLKNHVLTHNGQKPYQCNICKKCFIQKGHFQAHIRTHTGEKPFQCNICMKCFFKKWDLKTHNLTHTGEKPYQCNVCKKRFAQKGHLQSHNRTHTGEKPYQCNICIQAFSQNNDLKKHILTHTREKPYQCNVCKKYFNRKDVLKSHIRTHTGEKPYKCTICKKSFGNSSTYTNHIRMHKR